MRLKVILLALVLVLILGGCGAGTGDSGSDQQTGKANYKEISEEEALQLMQKEDRYVIVDVRTKEEYAGGHIPGAINIPNEDIDKLKLEELIDPDQTVILYCRSGRRSKEAAQKLVDLGYTKVYEMGGINDWSGELVTENTEQVAGKLFLTVNAKTLTVILENNEAAQKLAQLAWDNGLKLDLAEYGGFEKVGPLPESLPAEDVKIDADAGDLVLYQGDQLSLLYGQNTWEYTKLGHLEGIDKEQLQELLGTGDVTIELNVTREETNE